MAMNLNSVLRITAEVTGLSSLTKLEGAVEGVEKAARAAGQGFKAMLDSRAFQVAAAGAAALGAAIGLSAKAAIDFESSMADVRKVVSGIETPQAFAEISNEIIGLSNRLPIAAKGFAEIYAAAGQAGIAREDLKQFAEQVAQTAIAFDMTAEEAGTAMAKIKTSLGLSLPELQNLTDAMNHLSNNTASTAKDIVEFTLRAGQAGQLVGLSAEQTAAFGSAMIAAGANTEVAATSFNNMVKALSRGPSMTDRQIGALQKLGYVQEGAAEAEQRLTTEVEEQSRRRIEAARNETNEIAKEINRRYRDQLQAIRDGFDDENSAYTESLQDRADEQIKALQRQQEREIEAARARAEALGASADLETDRIRDAYEGRIDAIRDQLRDDLKLRQRADRDRLQQVQDGLDDQKDLEINAVQSRFQEVQRIENENKKQAIDAAKAAAAEASTAAAEQLAKGLQEDAIGTITDVFTRIRELPKEAQLSVVSDLFGDEAKAILPLINNTELLEKSLRLVGDQSEYAGSTLQEFLSRAATTANEAQLAQNNLQNLSIVFGQSFVPAITATLQVFRPLVEGFTWMVQNIPGLGPVLAVLTAGFVALVAALPVAASIVTLLGAFGGFAGILATISGTLGAVVPVLAGFAATLAGWAGAIGPVVAALGSLGQILIGVFSGPVGWVALAVAAGVAIYAFRDQIGQAFQAIGETLSMAAQNFQAIFIDPVVAGFQAVVDFVNTNFIQPMSQGISDLVQGIADTFKNVTDAITAPFKAAFETMRGIINQILNGIGQAVSSVVQAINNVIAGANQALANLGLPQIPYLPFPQIPQFAEGGVVSGPTLAMVGEGGEPEYIVPQSKAGASLRLTGWLACVALLLSRGLLRAAWWCLVAPTSAFRLAQLHRWMVLTTSQQMISAQRYKLASIKR
jgi:TP901 family phage tail tape measure protein